MSDISPSMVESGGQGSADPNVLRQAAPAPVAQAGGSAAPIAPPAVVRIWCGFVLALCVGMLGLGLLLTPDPDGMGKHQGLFGMPPCGFYEATGYPCPTCGCTTAVSHFAHGQLLTSLLTQPFGFFVAVAATLIIPFTGLGLVTGKWRGPSMFWLSWHWRYWVWGGVAILLLGWGFKIMMLKTGH